MVGTKHQSLGNVTLISVAGFNDSYHSKKNQIKQQLQYGTTAHKLRSDNDTSLFDIIWFIYTHSGSSARAFPKIDKKLQTYFKHLTLKSDLKINL